MKNPSKVVKLPGATFYLNPFGCEILFLRNYKCPKCEARAKFVSCNYDECWGADTDCEPEYRFPCKCGK